MHKIGHRAEVEGPNQNGGHDLHVTWHRKHPTDRQKRWGIVCTLETERIERGKVLRPNMRGSRARSKATTPPTTST